MSGWILTKDIAIVYAENAPDTELTACRELGYFIGKITGYTPRCVRECDYTGGQAILVHTETIPFAERAELDAADLCGETVWYAIGDGYVYLGGGTDRGVLYSAYTFLENELDCHRYTNDLETYPMGREIRLQKNIYSFTPKMYYRAGSFFDALSAPYMAFNKLNAFSRIPREYGGEVRFGIGFVHTLSTLVPESLYEEHPEYFPLIGGERKKGGGYQRCLTNPDVLKMTIEKVRADFRAHPDHKMASVSQNDGGTEESVCRCPACQKIYDEEGTLAGTQLAYVNAVADAIRDEFPDRYIETLAYTITRKPPRHIKPRKNVIIRLCSIECCFSHPLAECEKNADFVRDIRTWSSISENLFIWDYVTAFYHYLAPLPNLYVLGPNMRFFVDHHVVGMFPEGAPDAFGSELSELKSWILAKLEWDPDYDVRQGIEEFVRAYAGDGWKPVLRYITRLSERPALTGSHRGCYTQPDRGFFTEEFVNEAMADFREAKSLVSDPDTLIRIRRWEMSVRYVRVILYPDTFTKEELIDEIWRIPREMPELGISQFREGGQTDILEDRLCDMIHEFIPDIWQWYCFRDKNLDGHRTGKQ